jgi:outer membrane usher protein
MSLVRWMLALIVLAASHDAPAQAPAPLAFEVTLNGEPRGTVLLVQVGDELLLGEDDARAWRLRIPAQHELVFRGQKFHGLAALGLSISRLDRTAQNLELRAAASAFEGSTATIASTQYRLTPATWGGFATYDFVGTRAEGRSTVDGAFTLSAFAPFGSLGHQFVVRNLWSNDDAVRDTLRIATTFRRDWADRMVSLELGDTVSRPGAFGRALRFGGINAGTNYGLRPGFIRQPLPDLVGEASVPSTVEVFVQNQLRSVTSVPAGPFTLDDVPVISGAGDARVVVRDALGREQVISSSFYVAGGLLKQGLAEWNLAAGKLRDDFAGEARYGRNFASGLYRLGLTSSVTGEVRAEFEAERTRVIGAAVDVGGLWGEVEATAGLADVDAVGRRWLAGVGYRYVTLDYNVGLRWLQAQHSFRQAGDTTLDIAPRRTVTATAGTRIGASWSAGLGWLSLLQQGGAATRSFSASATWSVARGASLLFAHNRISEAAASRHVTSVVLSFLVGGWTTVNAGIDAGSERRQYAGVHRSLPFDTGWGYRATVSRFEDRTRAEGAAALNLPAATVLGEVVQETHQRAAGRMGVAGSVALIEDKPFAARQITDSFALVRVPGIGGAPILLNNQPAGSTDAEGRLVLPRMTAYVPNEIRVDVDALPPDAEISRDRETAVPPQLSGVVVTLGVRRTAAALVRVVTPSGKPIGVGAAVTIEPDGNATSVAQGGAFFVRAEPGRKRAVITERGERCTVEFEVAPTDVGAYRTLGPYPCVR